MRQGGVLTGQLEAAHLLLAELLLHIPLEHLVKLLVRWHTWCNYNATTKSRISGRGVELEHEAFS